MTAHVNIGSNKGNRQSAIDRAVALVASRCAAGGEALVSDPVETDPWGMDSTSRFVNVAMAFETTMAPDELIDALQLIEHSIDPSPHRDATGAYIDRAIDIDLIALDDIVIDTPRLTLPHPRMHLRDFVLLPMAAIAPRWRHPLTGLTPAMMLDRLKRSADQ